MDNQATPGPPTFIPARSYGILWALSFSAALHAALLVWGYWVIERVQFKPPSAVIAARLVLLEPGPSAPPAATAAPARPPAAAAQPVRAQPRAALHATLRTPPEQHRAPAQAKIPAVPGKVPALPAAAPNSSTPSSAPESNGTSGFGAGEPSATDLPLDAQAGDGSGAPSELDDSVLDHGALDHGALEHRAVVSSVRDGIDAAKRYPRLARQAGFEGRTLLKFKLLRSGDVQDLRVIESSGHSILDEAALNAVTRAAPFPGEGHKIARAYIEVILPVVFQLR